MKIYKPEEARKKICPFMSTINKTCCVAEDCYFWIKIFKMGDTYREITDEASKYTLYNGEDVTVAIKGFCSFLKSSQ